MFSDLFRRFSLSFNIKGPFWSFLLTHFSLKKEAEVQMFGLIQDFSRSEFYESTLYESTLVL